MSRPGKRIFVLDGHPAEFSISRQWAEAYADAARQAGHDVRVMHLNGMRFDPDFGQGTYKNWKPLEPDLEALMADIEWSEHVVLACPMWWGGVPAKLKGLFDRAFLPGRSFDMRKKSMIGLPKPMLSGRSGRVMITSDTPGWFLRLFYRSAIIAQLRGQILGFIGINPIRFAYYAGASEAKEAQVNRWIADARRLGAIAA